MTFKPSDITAAPPAAPLDKAEIVRILDVILRATNVDDNLDVYNGLSEFIDDIESGDFDAPTEALIDALLARGGVDEILRAEQGDERTRAWTLTGPAILVGIRLPMTHKRAEKTEGAE